jgi:hypothetical protein
VNRYELAVSIVIEKHRWWLNYDTVNGRKSLYYENDNTGAEHTDG